MTTVEIILGAVLILLSVVLIICVLMQSGKDHGLSGTIAGGAETFFGKSKAKTLDKKLSLLTAVLAIIFTLVVLSVYVMQDVDDTSGRKSTYEGTEAEVTTVADAEETTVAAEVTTAADAEVTTVVTEVVTEAVTEA